MKLRELMDDRGLLPIQVADAMNVTPGAVTKWIHGRAYPSADKLPKLADALNCSIDALFGRNPPGDTPAERRENHECQA